MWSCGAVGTRGTRGCPVDFRLHKTEVIARQGLWRGLDPVEHQTLVWVAWFNQVRLLSTIGYLPGVVCEAQYAATPAGAALVPAHT